MSCRLGYKQPSQCRIQNRPECISIRAREFCTREDTRRGSDWVDLGPNLSVTGSLTTILWLLALRKDPGADTGREGLDVSFCKFLEVGAVAMPVALFAALGGAIFMQMLVGQR
jgi:hypothetical protein